MKTPRAVIEIKNKKYRREVIESIKKAWKKFFKRLWLINEREDLHCKITLGEKIDADRLEQIYKELENLEKENDDTK